MLAICRKLPKARSFEPRFASPTAATQQRAGTTLVECVVATLIVGVLMVAALNSAGTSLRMIQNIDDRTKAQRLAGDLMNEILLTAYTEPGGAVSLGLDSGENTGNRSLFDDVDDYHNWSSSPPADKSGSAIGGATGWTQSVVVIWADPTTLGSTASTNTGLKRITVTISKGGTALAAIVAYRSIAWVDTIPAPTDATGNHAPTAVATCTDLTKNVGQALSFSATTSSDQDGDYLSYLWNFGDNTSATGTTATHTYGAAGNYTVTLTIYDGRGGIGTAQLTAVISP